MLYEVITPVVRNAAGDLQGVEAVIDKDRVSSLLATRLNARLMIILTAVESVCRRYGQPGQEALPRLDVATARRLLRDGEFPPGSMGPKIEAAIDFLEGGGAEVLITLPERLAAALEGKTGTRIVP